jgi:hypothetical protein
VGSQAALAVTTWFGGYDMTGDGNNTVLNLSYDALDATVYGCTARVRAAGLEDCQLDEAGFWQSGAAGAAVDPVAFTALGGASQVITNSFDGLETSAAYFYRAKQASYEPFGPVGELIPFRLTAQSARGTGLASVAAVRGKVLKTKAVVSATGATGTAQQLGAVGASQYLYAAFHEFAVGTTITGVIESNVDNTFGAPTTRITFGPITTVGGTWGTRVAGPITDTWWRLRITAITGSHTIACVAGFK